MDRIALFAGSFDPYTNGHHAIVRKATGLFDRVVVLIGVNVLKKRAFDAGAMRDAIAEAVAADGMRNVDVVVYGGLVADYCAENGIDWYVRGIRDAVDYGYEESNARVNAMLNPGLETVYFRADDAAISSSMVRELMGFGRDVSGYMPAEVAKVVRNYAEGVESRQ